MKTKNILIAGVALVGGAILYYQNRKTIPNGVPVVKPFDLDKYLGTWYEIARFDFFFEKDMDFVTANYSLNEDGSVKVVNRGYSNKSNKFKESVGRAEFVGATDEAKLKVSFWGPFYSGYNVVAIDEDYNYALVSGRNRNLLWILSREKEIPEYVLTEYLAIAANLGYDISKLVYPIQHE